MAPRLVSTVERTLPDDDPHPYRSGAWQPTNREWEDLDPVVVEGEVPLDLAGAYLRNTENPLHPSLGMYHPFDGDGMIHQIQFGDGRASYRNRFVRTAGLVAEQRAAGPLWSGMLAPASESVRDDGWSIRGRMKDASSTDVIVHGGVALTSFWLCGDVYRLDPRTLEPRGSAPWVRDFPNPYGVSAHTKLDEHTGELFVFGYSAHAVMFVGVVDPDGTLAHTIEIPLPGPRLPHDMAFTEHYIVLNDCPMFADESSLEAGLYHPRFHRDVPTRFGIVPRRGTTADVRWFEADPTYVLHWVNAYEDGDTVVLDGYFEDDPAPRGTPDETPEMKPYRFLDMGKTQPRLHRWRFDLITGATTEERISDRIMEFGMTNGRHQGRPHRYAYSMTAEPGWFLFNGLVKTDMATGHEDHYRFPAGVFASETPFAPREGATAEDDGYLVTFTSDVANDVSECWLFDAEDISAGPVTRIRLPERISSGTHSTWAPADALG